jgi:hypothetical protein
MAQEVLIGGTHSRAKIRNPVGVYLLSLITFGIYGWWWWYSINGELRDLGRAKGQSDLGDNPGLSMAAFALGGFLLYVPLVWTIVTTTKRIQRAQRLVGVQDTMSGWAAGLLWVFTLGIGGFIYTQWSINKAWQTQPLVFTLSPSQVPTGLSPTANGDLERLQKLAALKDSGAITQAEFDAEKAKLLPPQEPGPEPAQSAS